MRMSALRGAHKHGATERANIDRLGPSHPQREVVSDVRTHLGDDDGRRRQVLQPERAERGHSRAALGASGCQPCRHCYGHGGLLREGKVRGCFPRVWYTKASFFYLGCCSKAALVTKQKGGPSPQNSAGCGLSSAHWKRRGELSAAGVSAAAGGAPPILMREQLTGAAGPR